MSKDKRELRWRDRARIAERDATMLRIQLAVISNARDDVWRVALEDAWGEHADELEHTPSWAAAEAARREALHVNEASAHLEETRELRCTRQLLLEANTVIAQLRKVIELARAEPGADLSAAVEAASKDLRKPE